MTLFRTCGLAAALLLSASACTSEVAEDETSSSGTDEAYTAESMPAEVNRRVEKCFTHDWTSTQLRVENVHDIWGGDRYTVAGLTQLVEGEDWVFNEIGQLVLRGSTGEQVVQNLITALLQIRGDQHLADFQQAEVVMCVTSNLITYADMGLKALLGADEAVNHYEGVCREYAALAARLMKSMDLQGSFIAGIVKESDGNGGHAWNQIHLASTKTTYWIEPQDDPLTDARAVFFDPRPD